MRSRLALGLAAAFLVAFAVIPSLGLVAKLLWQGAWWETLVRSNATVPLFNTVKVSLGAAAIAFGFGFPLAVVLERTDLPARGFFRLAFALPSAVPPFIFGMGWVALANPNAGLLNQWLGAGTFNVYGPAGIAFVLGSATMPLVFLQTAASLQRVDPSLDEAARLSGAGFFRSLLASSVPLALPAGLSGAALAFVAAASAFGVQYLLGVTANPPTVTLTTKIYGEVLLGSDGLPRAAALSSVLLLLAGVVLFVGERLGRRGRVRLLSGKGLSRRPMELRGARTPTLVLVSACALFLVGLPLGAVALSSVQRTYGRLDSLSLSHWSSVLLSPRTGFAAGHSLGLAVAAALAITGLGLVLSLLKRRFGRLGKLTSLVANFPYAVPGTVLSLGFIVFYSRDIRFVALERVAFVLALANTLWMLFFAYVIKYLALGVRGTDEALAQTDPSLSEAARLLGAGETRAFFDATLPQLRAPLLAAFTLSFLMCATELTMSVMLVPPGAEVLGTLLFELQSYADPGAASVVACAFLVVVVVLMTLSQRWTAQRGARA